MARLRDDHIKEFMLTLELSESQVDRIWHVLDGILVKDEAYLSCRIVCKEAIVDYIASKPLK